MDIVAVLIIFAAGFFIGALASFLSFIGRRTIPLAPDDWEALARHGRAKEATEKKRKATLARQEAEKRNKEVEEQNQLKAIEKEAAQVGKEIKGFR